MKALKNLAGILAMLLAVVYTVIGIKIGGNTSVALVICIALFVIHFQYCWRKDVITSSYGLSMELGTCLYALLSIGIVAYNVHNMEKVLDDWCCVVLFSIIIICYVYLFIVYLKDLYNDFTNSRLRRVNQEPKNNVT